MDRRIGLILRGVLAAGVITVLAGCPSEFFAAIKDKIEQFPFTASSYTFVRQWGNPNPEYSFGTPVVRVDTAGYFYVADSTYRIRKFSSSGALQKTYDIGEASGLTGTIYDMAFDPNGNMYVANSSSTSPVLKYDVSGNQLSWTPGTTITTPRALAADSSGNLYVLDSSGTGLVLKFSPNGALVTSWNGTGYNGTGTAFSTPRGIAIYSSNVYVCNMGNGTVERYNSTTGAYIDSWSVTLSSPRGISCDPVATATFYVANTGASNVLKVTGVSGSSSSVLASGFTTVSSVAADASGNIYAADTPVPSTDVNPLGRIQKFNSSGILQYSWGGVQLTANGQFSGPAGVAFDSSGNVFVVDMTNKRIQKFSADGGYLGQWSDAAYKPWLGSIAVSPSGTVYAPDYTAGVVRVFDSSLSALAPIGSATLTYPSSVAVDSSGNIYVSDYSARKIFIFDSQGYTTHVPQTVGTSGTTDGTLYYPAGVTVDSKGNIYVVDVAGTVQPHVIQKFDKNGTFVKAWGTRGTGDGQFMLAIGIAVDKYDHVYVADFLCRRVQKFDSDGNFLGKLGGVGVGNGTFGWPFDVAVDSSGNVAVTDGTNNLVQIFSPAP